MNEQVAKCESTIKEVTERLHNYEELEAKSLSLERDLEAERAEKEALQREFNGIQENLKSGKFVENIFKMTSTYTSFAKDLMDSGLKFALIELKRSYLELDLSEMKSTYVEE